MNEQSENIFRIKPSQINEKMYNSTVQNTQMEELMGKFIETLKQQGGPDNFGPINKDFTIKYGERDVNFAKLFANVKSDQRLGYDADFFTEENGQLVPNKHFFNYMKEFVKLDVKDIAGLIEELDEVGSYIKNISNFYDNERQKYIQPEVDDHKKSLINSDLSEWDVERMLKATEMFFSRDFYKKNGKEISERINLEKQEMFEIAERHGAILIEERKRNGSSNLRLLVSDGKKSQDYTIATFDLTVLNESEQSNYQPTINYYGINADSFIEKCIPNQENDKKMSNKKLSELSIGENLKPSQIDNRNFTGSIAGNIQMEELLKGLVDFFKNTAKEFQSLDASATNVQYYGKEVNFSKTYFHLKEFEAIEIDFFDHDKDTNVLTPNKNFYDFLKLFEIVDTKDITGLFERFNKEIFMDMDIYNNWIESSKEQQNERVELKVKPTIEEILSHYADIEDETIKNQIIDDAVGRVKDNAFEKDYKEYEEEIRLSYERAKYAIMALADEYGAKVIVRPFERSEYLELVFGDGKHSEHMAFMSYNPASAQRNYADFFSKPHIRHFTDDLNHYLQSLKNAEMSDENSQDFQK